MVGISLIGYHGLYRGKSCNRPVFARLGVAAELQRFLNGMVVKLLYFLLPFVVGIGIAIGTFKLLVSEVFTIKWIKYSVLFGIFAFSLIFFALPPWHYRSEIESPGGLKVIEDKLISLRLIHRAVPVFGFIVGLMAGKVKDSHI